MSRPVRRQADLWWQCNGQIRPWEASWLNEPFYIESKAWYDDSSPTAAEAPATETAAIAQEATALSAAPTPSPTPSLQPSSTASTGSTVLGYGAPGAATLGTAATASSLSGASTVSSTSLLIFTDPARTVQSSFAQLTTSTSSFGSQPTTLPPAHLFADTQWDWQAKGTVAALAVAVTGGAMIWVLWAVLRGKFKSLYAPRTWFLPPGSRPPPSSVAATLTPFPHLPLLNATVYDAHVMTHVGASALTIAALSAVVRVGIFLTLSIANVPPLANTAPPNPRGGRLGSMTNLSLLRLLNALDTSPNSPVVNSRLLVRDLPSTIAPAMSGARRRLLAMLVLMADLWVGGTLFIIWRTYTKLTNYATRFDTACDEQSMVVALLMGPSDEGSVAGVFAIGELDSIKEQVRERAHVLEVLEEAEAKYIRSFSANPTGVARPASSSDSNHLSPGYRADSGSSARSSVSAAALAAQLVDFDPPGASGSAFLEVKQRNSVLRKSGRLHIGDEVVQDEDPPFLPATESSHEPEHPGFGNRTSYMTDASELSPPPPLTEYQPLGSRPQSILVPSALADLKAKITWSRSRLRKLNSNNEAAQQAAMRSVAKGDDVRGWIIVGRGVASLPFAQDITGPATEDIIWDNLAAERPHKGFWSKVVATGVIVAVICIPFMGLAFATAPGFAYRLGFLDALARDNGFGSGVAQGLVPATALSILLAAGVLAVQHIAKKTKPVSYSELNFLSLKGTTYLLSIVGSIWVIALGATLFGVDAYAEGSQRARAVADGVSYISWLGFVLVLLICIIAPDVMVLQPRRLFRRIMKRRKDVTPSQRFRLNQPPNYRSATFLAPLLAAMFYLSALCGVYPIITVPVLLLAHLSLVAHQWLTSKVFCVTRGGMSDGTAALWIVRRLGWATSLQPLVVGLVLLSRREWGLGAAGIGITLIALAASEYLTLGLDRRQPLSCFANVALHGDLTIAAVPSEEAGMITHRRQDSDHSILATVHTLLPSRSRLPADNPIPLQTDAIDDLVSTERAIHARPDAELSNVFGDDDGFAVTSPSDPSKGLIYPPELLQPAPTVWLARGDASVMQQEADYLMLEGLTAIVDPLPARTGGH